MSFTQRHEGTQFCVLFYVISELNLVNKTGWLSCAGVLFQAIAYDEEYSLHMRLRIVPDYANTAVSVDFGGVKQSDQDEEPVSTVDGTVSDAKAAA